MHVLVVEDEPRIRNMLTQALRGMDFEPTVATSAEEGERMLATTIYDILMLDLNLPGRDGLDFLGQIRRAHPGLQAIVLTGYGDLAAAKLAIHLDVVEFLSKPCPLGELEKALSRARARRTAFLIGTPAQIADLDAPATREVITSAAKQLPAAEPQSGATMEDVEREAILRALAKHNGNRSAVANELGISLRKLYYRLGEYQKRGLLP